VEVAALYLKLKKGNIMKLFLKSLALSTGLLLCAHGFAQTAPATPAKPAASATAPAASTGAMATPAKAPAKTAAMPAEAAPGGGDGKVWVNSSSKVYHCAGTKFYGKTKAGEYMSEADAKAKGNHANGKKACS
jgi:hypothetical protein